MRERVYMNYSAILLNRITVEINKLFHIGFLIRNGRVATLTITNKAMLYIRANAFRIRVQCVETPRGYQYNLVCAV